MGTAQAMQSGDHTGAKLALIGSLAVAIGAALPWVKVNAILLGTQSFAGTDVDEGKAVLALGMGIAVAASFAIKGDAPAPILIGALIATLAAAATTILGVRDVERMVDDLTAVQHVLAGRDIVTMTVGFGLWIAVFGAVAATVGFAIELRDALIAPNTVKLQTVEKVPKTGASSA